MRRARRGSAARRNGGWPGAVRPGQNQGLQTQGRTQGALAAHVPAIPPKHELAFGKLAVLGPVLTEALFGSGKGYAEHDHLGGLTRRAISTGQAGVWHDWHC